MGAEFIFFWYLGESSDVFDKNSLPKIQTSGYVVQVKKNS